MSSAAVTVICAAGVSACSRETSVTSPRAARKIIQREVSVAKASPAVSSTRTSASL